MLDITRCLLGTQIKGIFIIFQVRIVAYDNGSPARSSTVMAYVTVLRNFATPEFSSRRFNVNILESQTAGIPFYTVRAEDEDRNVSIITK